MKLIRHPQSTTSKEFTDCYMVVDSIYRVTVMYVYDLGMKDDSDKLYFSTDVVFLLLNGIEVNDPFIAASSFEEIKPQVGEVLVNALRNMVAHHQAEEIKKQNEKILNNSVSGDVHETK